MASTPWAYDSLKILLQYMDANKRSVILCIPNSTLFQNLTQKKWLPLPAFERQADKVQYTMLENKKRSFRDQKKAGRLPHVTLLENWRRELVARNGEDEDFHELMEKIAEEPREKDEKAHKRANDELVAALEVVRAQVGQPDPLAGRNEEERRQFVSLKSFDKKPILLLSDNTAEVDKKREGKGRITRSRRRIGGEANDVPAVVPEEPNMDDVEPNEVVFAPVDIPIGVPLGPEMLLSVEAVFLDVDLVVDEVQEPVEFPATNRRRFR
ncbi:hypothetical protein CAEBREN_18337 [Caenorhabditis brenneri]|uniref:Uncharacterized protein n=1 Tax=Caenorhabditis brenneri TaxID=135651 RepID=G0P366_CAEBE|nr:hypothetical protein CAEBREN_18337 [Caenorhabditis brenneri]